MTTELIPPAAMVFGGNAMLETALSAAGFSRGAPAGVLVNADAPPDLISVTARCMAFAEALPQGREGLVVSIVSARPAGLAAWQDGATAAALLSFTRDAALSWGRRGIRLNMIEVADGVPDADVAATVLAMLRMRSMTGQKITLGAA